MFTCPEKDIHSIYLDGELPEDFAADYEKHVAGCEKCRKIQKALKKTKLFFKKDEENFSFSQEEKDASFKRLCVRLSYSKVTGREKKSAFSRVRYAALGAAAAVAVFFVIPSIAGMNSSSAEKLMKFTPVANEALVSPANRGLFLDGSLDAGTIRSAFSAGNSSAGSRVDSFPVVHLNADSDTRRAGFASYDMFLNNPRNPRKKSKIPSFERYKSSNFHYYFPVSGIGLEK